MRPDRFAAWFHATLTSAATDDAAVESVTTFAEEGVTDPRYGSVERYATGAAIWWQVVFGSPDDQATWGDPEKVVEGDALPRPETPRPDLPGAGRLDTAQGEARLLHVVLSQGSPEIKRVYARSTEPSIYSGTSYGLHVEFHSGGSATVLPMYTLPNGAEPRGDRRHQVLEKI